MPPTSRRTDRTPTGAPASRSRMYNLAGHAHSSGSLLPRSTDVHAPSASTSSPLAVAAAASGGVDASDAPYLTNLEAHFGRVTLTAPDNLLRKQAKEKKQKIRQRKAQNAQAAAVALAGATQTTLVSSAGRTAMASSSNLLDSNRRYQTTLGEPPVSTGLLLPPAEQHMGMRRAYSGGHTPTLATTVNAHPTPSSTTQTVVARTRRRRPSSTARDEASRPASGASGPSRPSSALSSHDAELEQPASSTSGAATGPVEDRPPLAPNESANAVPRRSHNAFDTSRAGPDPAITAPIPVNPTASAPLTSMHRQNVWNDITEDDPDDLPPPFPVGAPRPPTPPLPPTHSQAANDAQLIGPQPHTRIPDSPPPAFVSDDEDGAASPAGEQSLRRQSPVPSLSDQTRTGSAANSAAGGSRRSSRASDSGSASSNEDESLELTQERRAWESDIQNGLSFEVRLLREQQRRVARERASALPAASPGSEVAQQPAAAGNQDGVATEDAAIRAPEDPADSTTLSVESESASISETLPESAAESIPTNITVNRDEALPLSNEIAQPSGDRVQSILSTGGEASLSRVAEALPQAEIASPASTVQEQVSSTAGTVRPAEVFISETTSVAPSSFAMPQTESANAITRTSDARGRLMLANETRLGLPSMPAPPRPTLAADLSASTTSPASRLAASTTRPVSAHVQLDQGQNSQINHVSSSTGTSKRHSARGRTSRPSSQAFVGPTSRLQYPLSQRPEDTLYVISAPPATAHDRSSSGQEASLSAGASDVQAISGDEDEGAESDSSIEQWLAESAAFDALRKREEEAAARLEALREPPVSDSDEEDDAIMPGAFDHRPSMHHKQASAARNVPDPAKLAFMDQNLPKAPPPLALGRSRGGAAYSDTSSESTDTDDALDQYSSSDEEDEQHRALHHARAPEPAPSDPFVNSHKSVHARNTSSAPNLAVLNKSEPDLAQRRPAEGTRTDGPLVHQNLLRNAKVDLIAPSTAKSQETPSGGPARRLSQKAKGKLPDRGAEQAKARLPEPRAGDFEEDSSSSHDLLDVEEPAVASKPAPGLPPASNQASKTDSLGPRDASASQTRPGSSLAGLADPVQVSARRSSLDPLFQPLAYGDFDKNDLRDRLKGLFGQPLVASSTNQPSAEPSAGGLMPSKSVAKTSPILTQAKRSVNDARRLSERNEQPIKTATPVEMRRDADAVSVKTSSWPVASPVAKQDDAASIAPSQASTQRAQPTTSSRAIPDRYANPDATRRTSTASVPPEQRARDEALLQIAQLAASTQSKQDSLAALERLLARTTRPVSLMPPSTVTRAELGGRLQPASSVAASDLQEGSDAVSAETEPSSSGAAGLSSNRLSRQGAIVRNRGPLPEPPSALGRATSSASRPVSFVNPRSSAAPLPRGRLPAITDATRHFPASGMGPNVAPSWLSYIPSEERERLPAPLEPQRIGSLSASRAPEGKVSAMISRFEAPRLPNDGQQPDQLPSSPSKARGSPACVREAADALHATSKDCANLDESGGSASGEDRAERITLRDSPRNESTHSGEQPNPTQRRPPPPPPTLPTRRSGSNPFRPAGTSERPTSTASSMSQSTSMQALARQIEEAAAEWTSTPLQGTYDETEQRRDSSGSRLAVPTTMPTSSSVGPSVPFRSPRTQAMHTLTRREQGPGTVTPPSLPPKSPLMTPEQILAAGSRNGLSASIAAAQAAAFARRDGRESRSHSASSSMDTTYSRHNAVSPGSQFTNANGGRADMTASPQASRPLPTLPAALRTSSSHGLGISAEAERGDAEEPRQGGLTSPPPLPTRPRFRDWDTLGTVTESMTQESVQTSPANARPVVHRSGGGTQTRMTSAFDSNGRSSYNTCDTAPSSGSTSLVAEPSTNDRNSPSPAVTPNPPVAPVALSSVDAPTSASPSSSLTQPHAPHREPSLNFTDLDALATASSSTSSTQPHAPHREPSLNFTDFDLLVAQLERSGVSHFEALSAIGDFLGPAKPTAATPDQLASLSVGLIECDSRRVTRDGKIKQKLSCVGVRVDKCPICFSQFKLSQHGVLFKCGHIFHKDCALVLLKRFTTCPVCRQHAV